MPPKSARAGAENWGKNWGKIHETRHKNGAANQQNCGKPVEKSAKLRFLIAASLSAPFGTKRSQVQILSPRPIPAQCANIARMFFIQNIQKSPFSCRAISELGENWGSLGEKKASRMGAERRRRAGNVAPLFFFIPQFFPQLGAIKQALRGLR